MARATSSLPVPVSPWSRIVLSLSAMRGSTSSTRRMDALRLTMSPTWKRPLISLRSSSMRLRSRKVSAPPTTVPCSSRSRAVETLIGMRWPSALTMNVVRVHDGRAGLHRVPQRALGLAHAGAEHVGAAPADGVLARDARDLLGGPVERGDAPVPVHGEDAVGDALEDRVGGDPGEACGSRRPRAPGHHGCPSATSAMTPIPATRRRRSSNVRPRLILPRWAGTRSARAT